MRGRTCDYEYVKISGIHSLSHYFVVRPQNMHFPTNNRPTHWTQLLLPSSTTLKVNRYVCHTHEIVTVRTSTCTCTCASNVTYITNEVWVTPGTLYNKREENKTNIVTMVAAQVLLPYIGPPALRISGSASCGIVGRYACCG